ncbi:MAG: hemerythrin domain-containing protein [Mycobacteriales bacterium]
MDAITLLKNDHKTVARLFKRFEKATKSGGESREAIVAEIIAELSVHAAIEEQVFYPAVRAEVQDAEDTTLEALEEHHVVKWTLKELEGMKESDERFTAKVTVLIESVRHHVKEEENEMFPDVREALGRTRLAEIGAKMEAARKTAPTRPQPQTPDEPPGNLPAGGLPPASIDLRTNVGTSTAKSTARKKASTR